MIKKTFRIRDETGAWIEKGAKSRQMGESEFLDMVATWPAPTQEGTTVVRPERTAWIAEELELPNGLLKIAREGDGLPVAFVRAKVTAAWVPIDWKKLEALNVEVQGLRRDKLNEEVLTLRTKRAKIEKGMSLAARTQLELQKDIAEPAGKDFPKWCTRCRVTVETPEELETHKAYGCLVRELEPGELEGRPSSERPKVWTGSRYETR